MARQLERRRSPSPPPCASAASSAAARPSSAARPPLTNTTPSTPSDWSSRAKRPAMLSWIPRRMLAAARPRETMLMTSVSASTAQIELTASGFVRRERERPDLGLRDAEVARDVLEELAGARGALARHLVAEHLAARVHRDGAGVERADVEHGRAPADRGTARRARASSCRRSGPSRMGVSSPSPVVAT